MKSLPIGKQTFANLIKSNSLYVDKTEYLYNLIKDEGRYFLSRPRRFGKSLTCSTLDAIFSGNKDLFKDLWIGQKSNYTWEKHPVVWFDFSGIDHATPEILAEGLHSALDRHAVKYSLTLTEKHLRGRFAELVKLLAAKHGPVVIIIDEYDKPITDLIDKPELAEQSREELRNFYGTLKDRDIDANMHLLFVTGVSKFAKTSLFSELNNLNDITLDENYASIVGYTQQEVEKYLAEHITLLAKKENLSYDEILVKLKTWYNGFRFSKSKVTVYNPFSLHNCLYAQDFSNYWFLSGTPNFLMKFIAKNPQIAKEIEFIDGSFISESTLNSFTLDLYYQNYKTLLLQTGYLTLASDYNAKERGYKVAYPNEEVRYSMTEQIMQFVGGLTAEQFGKFGARFIDALAADDLGLFCKHLQDFIKIVPHNIRVELEKFYQQIAFMVCVLFGKCNPTYVMTEVGTEEGFMDLYLDGTKYFFVVEFKRNHTAQIALEQIEHKRYWERFEILKTKPVILAGINFDETEDGVFVTWTSKELL